MSLGLSGDRRRRADVPPITYTQAAPVQPANAPRAVAPRDLGRERQLRLGVPVRAVGCDLTPYLAHAVSRVILALDSPRGIRRRISPPRLEGHRRHRPAVRSAGIIASANPSDGGPRSDSPRNLMSLSPRNLRATTCRKISPSRTLRRSSVTDKTQLPSGTFDRRLARSNWPSPGGAKRRIAWAQAGHPITLEQQGSCGRTAARRVRDTFRSANAGLLLAARARTAVARPTSTRPAGRSGSRCLRPTSRCPWSGTSSPRCGNAPAVPRSPRRSTRPSRSSRSSTRN